MTTTKELRNIVLQYNNLPTVRTEKEGYILLKNIHTEIKSKEKTIGYEINVDSVYCLTDPDDPDKSEVDVSGNNPSSLTINVCTNDNKITMKHFINIIILSMRHENSYIGVELAKGNMHAYYIRWSKNNFPLIPAEFVDLVKNIMIFVNTKKPLEGFTVEFN